MTKFNRCGCPRLQYCVGPHKTSWPAMITIYFGRSTPKHFRKVSVNQASQNSVPPRSGKTMTHRWPVAAMALCSEAARQMHLDAELFARHCVYEDIFESKIL